MVSSAVSRKWPGFQSEKFAAESISRMARSAYFFSPESRYATDSVSGAIFRSICSRAGVEVQTFHNHSDTLGGSTLGNLSNSQVSLNTVDIGLAQLAMHSACEIAGAEDTQAMIAALAAFYSTLVEDQGQGKYARDSAR